MESHLNLGLHFTVPLNVLKLTSLEFARTIPLIIVIPVLFSTMQLSFFYFENNFAINK